MPIESCPVRKKKGILYTVHVPVGTNKLMMTAVRNFSQREAQDYSVCDDF